MSQIFKPSTNTLAKVTLFGAIFFLLLSVWILVSLNRSAYATRQTIIRAQPVPFSHKHHVKGLGLDCRYCHWPAETSATAGVPPTKTCMTCHSVVWKDAPILEPVRASYRDDSSIPWTRVHDQRQNADEHLSRPRQDLVLPGKPLSAHRRRSALGVDATSGRAVTLCLLHLR